MYMCKLTSQYDHTNSGEKYLNLVVTLYVIRSLVDCFVLGDKIKSLFYLKCGR